ncbi:MAG: hypothetical protein K0S44_1444 [Bacteroidetes bacterium]|jgi:hypothetical protein|nr:hypothetical protein [Bacteroidota bacterium]
MTKANTALINSQEKILNQIYYIREHKVMLDIDLAVLYCVENRALKQAVRRNMDLFPTDFKFNLTETDLKASQNV